MNVDPIIVDFLCGEYQVDPDSVREVDPPRTEMTIYRILTGRAPETELATAPYIDLHRRVVRTRNRHYAVWVGQDPRTRIVYFSARQIPIYGQEIQ